MWDQNKQSQPQPQPQTYIIQTSTRPTHPVVVQAPQPEGWWKRNYKNKPQQNAVGSASLIFISGGMSMAWNLGIQFTFTPTDLLLSWFIGCIIGVVIGALACNYIHKKILTCFSALLIAISGILMVSDPDSIDAITAARYLNGIAVGLVFPLTFVLVGEVVVKSMRGMNAVGIDTMSFGIGIFVQTTYTNLWATEVNGSFSVTQMNGVLNIIWGCMAFFTAIFLVVESPLFYLKRNQEEKTIDVLRRLQRPFIITHETYEQLEEHKRYLAESNERSVLQSAVMGLPALLKLCFYRSFMALSFSFFTNFAFMYACTVTSVLDTWPYYIYGIVRWIGPIIFMFIIDSKGRKVPMIFGFCLCCILTFTIGNMFDDNRNLIDASYMNAAKYLLIFFQLFAGVSMSSCSVYLSEAFPLAVKPYYVAIAFIIEMLVHIIIICSKTNNNILNIFKVSDYFYTLGALYLVFFFIAIFALPETKWNTLRECLTKFRKLINYRS